MNEASRVQKLLNDQHDEIIHLKYRVEKLRHVLRWSMNILENMARENEGAIFFRWPIHHEPLRADARALLPIICAALEDEQHDGASRETEERS